ncbi:unnamed protein product [Allacma fusca]|uniref:G-protein coupled receptors family 1 profile domain-containing protein n=1 Tax=Allacma fusca TaxID=39272 RepID=A0A8J2KLW0_9HEXA|nr:unnamed protein product [Allacma fusca]
METFKGTSARHWHLSYNCWYLVEYFQKLSVPFAHLIWRRHIISCFLECPTFQSRNPGLVICINNRIYFAGILPGLVATLGNVLFIVTVTRWRLMRSNAHMILLLNLAVCDLSISVVGYPYTTISGYLGWWPFGGTMCILYGFLCFTFAQVSMNSLVAVSMFRYVAVCMPHKQHLLTSGLSWWAVGISWGHALFWTASPLLGWSSYTFEPTGISCSLNWHDRSTSGMAYTLACTIFCYVTHVMALLWFYREIFAKVHNLGFSRNWRDRQQQIIENEIPSPSPLARCESVVVFSFITENLSPLEIHVLRMNVIMVLSFLICWSPYAIVSVISIFNDNLHPVW